MTNRVLLAWIGRTDLRAVEEAAVVGSGPIAQACEKERLDRVLLLSDYPRSDVDRYVQWLKPRCSAPIDVVFEPLSGPTNFGEIFAAAGRACAALTEGARPAPELVFHLSPGTPAMAAVWMLLSKTRFPATLIESSREHGVRTVDLPFEISLDFIPELLRERDERLKRLAAADAPEDAAFAGIIHRSRVMARLVERAKRVALRRVPVLIEGPSGSGKELLARAIHNASPRRREPFKAINCGAISPELVESELFGHRRGAFTGATHDHKGVFEAANKGTLFLDEVGELPLAVQVKLLRVLQEGEILRVGTTDVVPVDVRVIAATNRSLSDEIAAGRFREDLFYRLAVAVLHVPPLGDRGDDIGLLVDRLFVAVNGELAEDPGYAKKKLSAGARNLLLGHSWPGNVRELLNTLRRAAIWSDGETITAEDAREALLPAPRAGDGQQVLGRPLGDGFRLPEVLEDVARHYLKRALKETNGNKTRAAELVGLRSYQTLTNWLEKYGVAE